MDELRCYEDLTCEIPIAIKRHYTEKGKAEEEEKKWVVEGYASMPGIDRNEPAIVISREAMKNSEDDLKQNSTVFLEHQRSERVGVVLDSKVDRKGLWVKILISKTAKDVWKQIQEGVLNALSIGAKILESITKIDRGLGKLVEIVTKMEIFEVSLVGLPANPDTKIISWREEALQPICDYVFKSLQDFETKNEGGEKKMTQEEIKGETKEEEKISKQLEGGPEEKKEELAVKPEEKVVEKVEEKVKEKVEEKVAEKAEEKKEEVVEKSTEIEEMKKPKEEYEYGEGEKKKELEKAKESAVGKVKEAISILEKVVEAIEGYYKEPKKSAEEELEERKKKYPKPGGEEEEEKKKKPEEYDEYYKEQKKALDEIKKSIEELSKKVIGEDKIKEIAETTTKSIIKEIPEPPDIRKGLVIKEEEEKEIKDPRKRLGKHIEEMLR